MCRVRCMRPREWSRVCSRAVASLNPYVGFSPETWVAFHEGEHGRSRNRRITCVNGGASNSAASVSRVGSNLQALTGREREPCRTDQDAPQRHENAHPQTAPRCSHSIPILPPIAPRPLSSLTHLKAKVQCPMGQAATRSEWPP